ncbi:MAG TPA: threonylcarbamoyl-AMP synthase [Nitrospirae bacterium]|nr:threonylcarbamoyl-AMP synthase [Nitrospirota bacterium]
MEFIKVTRTNKDEVVRKAVECILAGGVVAFPTETFYGLGVHFNNEDAIRRLYDLKKRPFEKAIPLIIGHLSFIRMLSQEIPEEAERLMAKYWPGPLTIVLKAREGLSPLLTAGTGKVAVRIPGESIALEIARITPVPVTATSANPSGAKPATDAQEVLKYFGDSIDLIVDGGTTSGVAPSTIVEIVNGQPRILRKGVIETVSLD